MQRILFAFVLFFQSAVFGGIKVEIQLLSNSAKTLFDALNVKSTSDSLPCEGCAHQVDAKNLKEAGISCRHDMGTDVSGKDFDRYSCTIAADS